MAIQIRTSLAEPETGEAFVPHKPARPDKAEGGKRSSWSRTMSRRATSRPAIRELVEGIGENGEAARCSSASPARARPSPWPRSSRRCSGPALVIAPNKILAAQLYGEFKSFFPDNAVEYFVSYYDYYQPEAYVPRTDTYIEKESQRERGDRPDAPLGDAVAARARRRDHRRLGLVPLRHRLGRDLFGDDLQPEEGRRSRTSARSSASSSRCSTGATTRRSRAAISGCAATASRSSRRTMRTRPGACQLLRRRDRGDQRVRSADRQDDRQPRQHQGLCELALCDARADAEAGDGGDPATSSPSG